MNKKELIIRIIFSITGVIIIALGAAILNIGQVGADTFTAANLAIGKFLGLSLGTYQLTLNIFFLVITFFFGRKYIGLGTLVTMTSIGFLVEFFSNLLYSLIIFDLTLFLKTIFLLFGTSLFTFGIAFYISANIGVAPYDSITLILTDYTKIKYKYMRVLQDVSFMILAIIFKGPIGIGTLINAFFTGPFISFWFDRISNPLINRLLSEKKE